MSLRRTDRAVTHRHPMRVVTRRTGLSAEILRIWERRYGVVKPGRTQTGRRLYSDAEIERLQLLFRATQGGRSIGLVASLSTAALTELLRQDAAIPEGVAAATDGSEIGPATRLASECLRALKAYRPDALGAILQRAALALPASQFLEGVVEPFMVQVDTRGKEGTLRSVHSHLATAVVRRVLENAIVPITERSPRILVATLAGQSQAVGALVLAVAAAAEGWSVTWLGTDYSADDIAEAASGIPARAVALSLTNATPDQGILDELRRLPTALPQHVRIIARSSPVSAYAMTLDGIGAIRAATIAGFRERILELALTAPSSGSSQIPDTRPRKRR